MSTTTRTFTPTYAKQPGGSWGAYRDGTSYSATRNESYAFKASGDIMRLVSLQVTADVYADRAQWFSCSLYSGDPFVSGGDVDQADTFYGSSESLGWESLTFTFTALPSDIRGLYFSFFGVNSTRGNAFVKNIRATATYEALPLGVTASPATVYTGSPLTLTFSNRLDATLTVAFRRGSTPIRNVSVASDTYQITPDSSWFTDAGESGSSMSVTVAVSDEYGRTGSASFTLKKPAGGSATPSAPASVTKDGTAAIPFTWAYSGDGTQTQAELQWKTSSGDWQSLGSVSGAGTSLNVSAWTFPVGSISWRVRAKNSYGLTGAWSSAASFTVSYPTLGVTASPSTLFTGSALTLTFSNRLSRTLTVAFKKGATPIRDVSVSSNSYQITPGDDWFTTAGESGSSMSVTVAVSDDYGRTASASFTLKKPAGGSATPSAPASVTKDGTAAIPFTWAYSGDGTQTRAELQWKTSSGDWQSLGSVSGDGTSLNVSAWTFPVGSISWRVRAKNSYGLTGAWSSAASFSVSYPALGVTASPSALFTGSALSLTFSNRLSRTLTVAFKKGTTPIRTVSVSSNSYQITPDSSWFTDAGESGSSMSVTVAVSDDYGRTGSTSFTLKKPTAGTATPSAPVSVTKDGTAAIPFTWAYSGDGTQARAELQWKTSSGDWQSLGSVSGDSTSLNVSAWTFPVGSISWRVRAKNSYGLTGSWSSAASFTVSYPALGVTASPSTLFTGSALTLTFSNRLSRTLTVAFKKGTTPIRTVNVSSNRYQITPGDDWFTTAGESGSSMSVTVAVSDDHGRTASASVTLKKPTAGTATPSAPKNITVDGTQAVTFAWTYAGDGTQAAAELQWSTDNAVWQTLAAVSDNTQTQTIPAVSFPAGRIYWRARVKNSFGLWSEWSSSVYFTAQYEAVSQTVPVNSPTTGLYNAAAARTFTIALAASAPVYSPFTVAAATLYWRSGESGSYNEVTMTADGNTASATIAAGTFPSGTIQWYAEATDNTGRTTSTVVYTLQALNAPVEAAPIRPINTVESGSGPIDFVWSYGSLDGSPQSAADLQWKTATGEWTDLQTVPGSGTTWTAPKGTFPGGTIYWRVRSYNEAGTAGDWSSAASFTAFSAPIVSGVTGDGKPFLTVTWQAEGQLAYELEINGKLYGPYAGENVRKFRVPEPLPDGINLVRVRAQNRYKLWSVWTPGEISVTNVPGPAIDVTGYRNRYSPVISFSGAKQRPVITRGLPDVTKKTGTYSLLVQVMLGAGYMYQWYTRASGSAEWEEIEGATLPSCTVQAGSENNGRQYRVRVYNAVGEVYSNISTYTYHDSPTDIIGASPTDPIKAATGYFTIWRDGKAVGQTDNIFFVDLAAIGLHKYYVTQTLPNGYYTKSNVVSARGYTENPAICLLGETRFLELRLSENQRREARVTIAQQVAYVQYAGSEYPEAEIGEHRTKEISLDVAALMEDEGFAADFERLIGQRVIVKTPGDEVVIGVLPGVDRRDPRFNKSWVFTVKQSNWRDFLEQSGDLGDFI